MDIDFKGSGGWRQRASGTWEHTEGCVATHDLMKEEKKQWVTYKFQENVGDLLPARQFRPRKDRCILRDFKDRLILAGKTYIMFNRIYEAMSTLGRFKLGDLYIKEQTEKESIVAFYYMNTWFVVAPVQNAEEDVTNGKKVCLYRDNMR